MDYNEDDVSEDAKALHSAIIYAAKELGKEGSSGMGAIEFLAVKVQEAGDAMARSNEAVAEALEAIASELAVRNDLLKKASKEHG